MNEMQINDVMVVWELRGDYPEIPLAADVNYEELIAGDDNPMFLTLPIGKAGVTSGNKRHYDEAWVKELERQALEHKPVGLMGHLREEDRATAFPAEAIHWIGARRVGELLWGKGYVPPGPVRDRIRRYKAAGKRIATSIDAFAEGVWDEALKAYRMKANTMKLNQIDLAPADRAGIPDLASVPIVTTEMESDEEGNPMDKVQVIREMTVEDADLLPKPVREAILATVPEAPEVQLVTELRTALGVGEDANLPQLITELKQAEENRKKEAVRDRIKELVEDKEKGIKLESARSIVTELVKARNPQTVEEADAAYEEVRKLESVTELLKTNVQERMGPPLRTGVQALNGERKYFVIPEDKD